MTELINIILKEPDKIVKNKNNKGDKEDKEDRHNKQSKHNKNDKSDVEYISITRVYKLTLQKITSSSKKTNYKIQYLKSYIENQENDEYFLYDSMKKQIKRYKKGILEYDYTFIETDARNNIELNSQDSRKTRDTIKDIIKNNNKEYKIKNVFNIFPEELTNLLSDKFENLIPRSIKQEGNKSKIIFEYDKSSGNIVYTCKYKNITLTLTNKDHEYSNFKISTKHDGRLGQIGGTTTPEEYVVNSLITESRADGNFGIESGLINAKLVLLNRLNKNILIAPINWNDEHFINMQDENFIQNIKNNSNITENTKLILVPIFYQNHISTLIIENIRPEKLAIFDSSTAHLEKDKDDTLKVKTTILNSNLVKNIIVLNTENLQDLDLNIEGNADLISKVKKYSEEQDDKSKEDICKSNINKNIQTYGNKIHLGNCGYYALHFAEYIMTKQDEYGKPYQTIEQIRNNMATIKEQIQEDIKIELDYMNKKVLFNHLANSNTSKAYTKQAMHTGEIVQAQTQVQSQVQTPPTFDQTRQFVQQHLQEMEEQYNNDRQHIQATQQHTRQSSHSSSASFIVE